MKKAAFDKTEKLKKSPEEKKPAMSSFIGKKLIDVGTNEEGTELYFYFSGGFAIGVKGNYHLAVVAKEPEA